jgi:hypothetical protein
MRRALDMPFMFLAQRKLKGSTEIQAACKVLDHEALAVVMLLGT